MKLSIGDRVLYRKNGLLYEGNIKSIQGEKIEIDDNSIKLIVVSKPIGTIADNLTFESPSPPDATTTKVDQTK